MSVGWDMMVQAAKVEASEQRIKDLQQRLDELSRQVSGKAQYGNIWCLLLGCS